MPAPQHERRREDRDQPEHAPRHQAGDRAAGAAAGEVLDRPHQVGGLAGGQPRVQAAVGAGEELRRVHATGAGVAHHEEHEHGKARPHQADPALQRRGEHGRGEHDEGTGQPQRAEVLRPDAVPGTGEQRPREPEQEREGHEGTQPHREPQPVARHGAQLGARSPRRGDRSTSDRRSRLRRRWRRGLRR